MASQWYSLVAQKLFLANTLLARLESDTKRSAAETEALSQGSAELLLRARQTLLVMIARYHQHKAEKPQTLAELEALFPYEVHETRLLRELAETSGSWWNHLDQVESALSQPPTTRKNVTEENIIAVSVGQGPDRSAATLRKTLAAMTELANGLRNNTASGSPTLLAKFPHRIEYTKTKVERMSPSFFEIVQLANGDYALRRIDDDAAPLVRISFSQEAREMMEDRDMSVAKAMIAAGIEAAGNIAHDIDWDDDDNDLAESQPQYTLH